MRILVVEDQIKLAKSIKMGLQEASYSVDMCHDGEEGLLMAQATDYDAIILDLILPKMDGLTVLKKLRADDNKTAVVILTAVNSVDDRVKGLQMGADDYISKPFAFAELIARIEAVKRRQVGRTGQVLSFKELEMDLISRCVKCNGAPIELRPKEYSILRLFLENPNQVITRTMISESAWNYSYDIGSNVIDVHIKRLREKINANISTKLITTIKGVGYRLA